MSGILPNNIGFQLLYMGWAPADMSNESWMILVCSNINWKEGFCSYTYSHGQNMMRIGKMVWALIKHTVSIICVSHTLVVIFSPVVTVCLSRVYSRQDKGHYSIIHNTAHTGVTFHYYCLVWLIKELHSLSSFVFYNHGFSDCEHSQDKDKGERSKILSFTGKLQNILVRIWTMTGVSTRICRSRGGRSSAGRGGGPRRWRQRCWRSRGRSVLELEINHREGPSSAPVNQIEWSLVTQSICYYTPPPFGSHTV